MDQKQLSAALEDISVAARERRREYCRRREGGGGRDVEESDTRSYGPHYDEKETGDAWVGR